MLFSISGCAKESAQEQSFHSEADNGLLTIEMPAKLLTAADVEISDEYNFAYNSEVIDGLDTYDNSNPITISAESGEILIYGSTLPIDSVEGMEPIANFTVTTDSNSITIDEMDTYFKIISSEPTSLVVSV